MPQLTILMIRSAFLHLMLGFLIGSILLWQKGFGGVPSIWRWLPIHIHLLLYGWIVQLALGVAYWILPRFSQQEEQGNKQVRGRRKLAWTTFILLNLSTLAALLSLLSWTWALPTSGVLVVLAALAFVLHAWPRVKPFMVP